MIAPAQSKIQNREMLIRVYQPHDLPTLHRIDRTCFPRGVAYSLAELRAYIESDDSLTLVAEDEQGRIGGFIIAQLELVRVRRRERSSVSLGGHIITIDVLPDFRNRGLGTELLQRAEQWLGQHGAETVLLETAIDNELAISFYRKHGYAMLDLLRDYYANGSDAYLMAKSLKDHRPTSV
jgi:ribosomal-protein-alanine N-acetyltransferase